MRGLQWYRLAAQSGDGQAGKLMSALNRNRRIDACRIDACAECCVGLGLLFYLPFRCLLSAAEALP
jgi:hypothetical protein